MAHCSVAAVRCSLRSAGKCASWPAPRRVFQEHLWIDAEGAEDGTFWDITSHTLYWLDLYLKGCSVEAFTPTQP